MSERLTEWNAMVQTKGWGGRRNHCISLFERQTKPQKALLHFLCYFGIFPRPWDACGSLLLSFLAFILPFWDCGITWKKHKCKLYIYFVVRQVFNPEFADLHWLLREPILIFLIIFFPKHMEITTCTSILYSSHEVNTTIKTSVSFSYITIL